MIAFHDNIIFNLQKQGGISTYWRNLKTGLHKKIDIINNNPITQFTNIHRFLDVNIKGNPGIFHSSFYRLPYNKKIPVITTVHDFIHEKTNHYTYISKKINSIQKLRAINHSNHIICVSENTKNDLLEIYPHIPEWKISFVHLAVDQSEFYPEPCDQTDEFTKNSVIFVGNRFGYKNFNKYIDTIISSSLNILIIGNPLNKYELSLLQNMAPHRWRIISNCTNSQLRQLYSNCFALMYPSYYEGFGLPLIEAYACKCPVIHSGKASLIEVLNENDSLVAHSGDSEEYNALLQPLFSKDFRVQLFKNYENKMDYFKWDRVVDQTLKIYKQNEI
jgi:mannosyltransferase